MADFPGVVKIYRRKFGGFFRGSPKTEVVIMLGATAFLKTLEKAGVEYIFGTPGSTEVPLIDEMDDFPRLKYILALHESVAVAMADGYARASGKPGVVSVHTTVGTANTLGMVINAFAGDSPVVVTAGIKDSRALGSGVFCDSVYHVPDILRQYTRWAWQVLDPETISRDTAVALGRALAPPGGPSFLAIPENFLTMEAGEKIYAVPGLSTVPGRGDKEQMAQAARILASANKPVILAGNVVGRQNCQLLVVRLAEMLGAPVFTEEALAAEYCNFPTNHPLFLGNFLPESPLIKEADVLLGLGAKMFMPFSRPKAEYISPRTRIIEVCPSPDRVSVMYPAELSIVADIRCFMEELIEILGSLTLDKTLREERYTRVTAIKFLRDSQLEQYREWSRDRYPIRVVQLVQELSEIADRDCAVVNEGITLSPYLQNYFDLPASRAYYGYSGGCLGWAVPAAMGIKLYSPERQVIAFVGDGSLLFSVQSLWTAARYDIAVKVIVCNNSGYMAVKSSIKNYRGKKASSGEVTWGVLDSPAIDFISLAKGFGVPGHRIESPRDLGPVLREVLVSPGPELVEIVVDPADSIQPPPELKL